MKTGEFEGISAYCHWEMVPFYEFQMRVLRDQFVGLESPANAVMKFNRSISRFRAT